jgi:hypothetical protein
MSKITLFTLINIIQYNYCTSEIRTEFRTEFRTEIRTERYISLESFEDSLHFFSFFQCLVSKNLTLHDYKHIFKEGSVAARLLQSALTVILTPSYIFAL